MDINNIVYPALCLGGMGISFGLILGYAGVIFKVEEDERIPLVRTELPGANCGACGYTGCDAYANAVVSGKAKPNLCSVGGTNVTQKVSAIMGIEAVIGERNVAFIRCKGDCDKSKEKYDYQGIADCTIAAALGGGSKGCAYACLGQGSCFKACEFGAIQIVDGIAVVTEEKCVACGKCVDACPKHLIEFVPESADARVGCHSNDNGKVVKGNCAIGCIGCKLCQKACAFDAITVENFLAKIDYQKCTRCNECVAKCPTSAIRTYRSKKTENKAV